MELQTPFVTAVAVFDFSKHLSFLRDCFAHEKAEGSLKTFTAGFATTLSSYGLAQQETWLPQTPEAQLLVEAINAAARDFAAASGYAVDRYTPKVSNFWLNEMVAHSVHNEHAHYGQHFSGCLYVDMPQNTAGISFSAPKTRFDGAALDVAQYTVYNSGSWLFHPKEGQLFLWESWLRHSVPAAEFEGVRRTAALDVLMHRN